MATEIFSNPWLLAIFLSLLEQASQFRLYASPDFKNLFNIKKANNRHVSFYVMPKAGVEPALPWRNQILSLARLPIPPLRRNITTGVAGFEPTHEGVKVPCLTAWLYPIKRRMTRIELASAGATSRCVNHFTTSAIMKHGQQELNPH